MKSAGRDMGGLALDVCVFASVMDGLQEGYLPCS